MSETKKITNIITPNGEDLQLTDSEAVHKENNIITEKITLANQLEFVPSNENTDSNLPIPVLSMDETNGGLRIDGRMVQGDSANVASGVNSHAEGSLNNVANSAIGAGSHAEGYSTIARGHASHAEGVQTKILLVNSNPNNTIGSHVEGNSCEVSNKYAHAEGEATKASGRASHSEGEQYRENNIVYSTEAIGLGSHAEGGGTQTGDSTDSTKGSYAHSEGILTKAIYEGSHAEGYNTKTSKAHQHVSGQYNADNSNALFIIGNGTSDTNRKNALEVLEDGTINLSSDKAKITNVDNPTDDYDAVNKQYVNGKISTPMILQYFSAENNSDKYYFNGDTIYIENGTITFNLQRKKFIGMIQNVNGVNIFIDDAPITEPEGYLINQQISTLKISTDLAGSVTISGSESTEIAISQWITSLTNRVSFLEQRIVALEQQLAAQSNS